MFQKSKIESLIKRATLCKPSIGSIKREEIDGVAKQLNICFSDDFYQINESCDYEGFYGAGFEFFCFYLENCNEVVEETQKLRQDLHLPHRYVILSNPGDMRVTLIETQESPDKNSPVIDCEPYDMDNLIAEKPLQFDHDMWPSFTDFFEYLVEQEEESLQKGKV